MGGQWDEDKEVEEGREEGAVAGGNLGGEREEGGGGGEGGKVGNIGGLGREEEGVWRNVWVETSDENGEAWGMGGRGPKKN